MKQKTKTWICLRSLPLIFWALAFPLSAAYAAIEISGLDDNEDLKNYVQNAVLNKYEQIEKDGKELRGAAIRDDLEKALKAKGYYDPVITFKETREQEEDPQKSEADAQAEEAPDGAPASFAFHVRAGTQYTIEAIRISGIEGMKAGSLKEEDILDAENVLGEQRTLVNKVAEEECFYNLGIRHEVMRDRQQKKANLHYIVEGENDARFGQTEFVGADSIKRKHLSRFLQYEQDTCWSDKKLEATKTALLETGLLSSIDIEKPETLPENKAVPLVFNLKERAPRTIRLGAKYNTSEGPGVSGQWRHRNYFGSGEEVTFKAQLATLLQSAELGMSKPFFLSKKQSLSASVLLERQDTDAYEERRFNIRSSINRAFTPHWTGSIGASIETSTITDQNGKEETFGLISIPTVLSFDNRDDVLDPHKGHNLIIGVEPFVDAFGESDPFFKSRITGTMYFDLSDSSYDPVLALRGSFGSILGSGTGGIPASKRFHAGGGGSIRGFGYQEAGPKSANGDPAGGRSVIEANAEFRIKLTETIGGVAFVDAGGAYDSMYPDFDEGVYVGAGIGARYYTNFGPIRFDVGVPVNKKEATDRNVQIYISIGQAF